MRPRALRNFQALGSWRFYMPLSSRSQERLVVVTLGRRLSFCNPGHQMALVHGVDGGCNGLSHLEAPAHRHARGMRSSGQCCDLHPPRVAPGFGIWHRSHLARRSGSPATLDLAFMPRPNGAGERTRQSSASRSAPPRKESRGEEFHQVSPRLGSRETRDAYQEPRPL